MKWTRNWKIPQTVLQRWILCFSSYKNCKLKVKLSWVKSHTRKKRTFLVPFFCQRDVLSQCIVYWIHFQNQNIHTFTYQKSLLYTLLSIVFKIVESLKCILNLNWAIIMANCNYWACKSYMFASSFEQCSLTYSNLQKLVARLWKLWFA